MTINRTGAVNYVTSILRRAKDWQEGEHALANHPIFGPWLEDECAGDEYAWHSIAQSLIREAEEKLGDAIPY